MRNLLLILFTILTALWAAPSVGDCQTESYTYQLQQSTAALQFWTTTPGERIFKDDPTPDGVVGSEVKVYAARNEFEPFQIIVKPTESTDATVAIGDFGAGIEAEVYQVAYVHIEQATDNLGQVGDYPDPLWPLENGAEISLTANENTAFWFSLFVPPGTVSGDYTGSVQIGGIEIPVRLHVFDFAIPDELHVKSQMNFSHSTILNHYGVTGTGDNYWMYVDKIKQYFIDHRLTPKSVLWSGGLTTNGSAPYIDYDCNGVFTDNDGIWGFESPADIYLNGNGFNDGVGFPSFMSATFRNNDSSSDQRPSTFCGHNRNAGDWYTADNPNSAYNQEWFEYVAAIENYLTNLGYLDKAYYYFANEPQDQTDYDAVAWYSQHLKAAAPNFKLMISEEPKSEIYDHPQYSGSKIDIWLPVLNNYDPIISHERAANHDEETWIYFLYGTRPPYFNPITLDHPGIESKLTGWFLWKYRARGIAYYSLNNWSQNPWTNPMNTNHNGDLFMLYPPSMNNSPIAYGANNHRFVPSIRFELMRDSMEDYEYLYVLNNNSQPIVYQDNTSDPYSDKIINGLTGYTRDSEFMYNLRRLIGLYVGGEIAEIPDIQPPARHPRSQGPPGDYYINFQDPDDQPQADPLVVDDNEYMKIGWIEYDQELGYGWFGDLAHVMYRYLDNGPNELQRSVVYDDWGRQKVFEFDLPIGTYSVTVSVGWHNRSYPHHKIDIEGVAFIDDEATTPTNPYIVRTDTVTVEDYKLSMDIGIFDEYTMLNYLNIEALGQPEEPILSVVPAVHERNYLSGSVSFDVSNIGVGSMQWTAVSNADWLTINSGNSGTNGGSIAAEYTANFGNARVGTITVTADGASNSPQIVETRQEAGNNIHLYEVGPGKPYQRIIDCPTSNLVAGDTIKVFARTTPYYEKFLLYGQGSEESPIVLIGMPDAEGNKPILDGQNALTDLNSDYYNEDRQTLLVGQGARVADHIVIHGFTVRNANRLHSFIDDHGNTSDYASNAAGIRVGAAGRVTIRNCEIYGNENGIFSTSTENLTIENCYVHDNGAGDPTSAFEHNLYLGGGAGSLVTVQFCRFGDLLNDGQQCKFRAETLIFRYNWVQGGKNSQLDMVENEDNGMSHAYVYGNVIIKPEGSLHNGRMIHFGGDLASERVGSLYFFNNSCIYLADKIGPVFQISEPQAYVIADNNIFYVGNENQVALWSGQENLTGAHNWLSESITGAEVLDQSVTGEDPLFVDPENSDYRLGIGSSAINAAGQYSPPDTHNLAYQYIPHLSYEPRPVDASLDIGAFESPTIPPELIDISPNSVEQADIITAVVTGRNSHFTDNPSFLIRNGNHTVIASNLNIIDDLTMSGRLSVPADAPVGEWDAIVTTSADGELTLSGGVGVILAPPTSLTASVFSDSQIELVWTNISLTQTAVCIERSSDQGATYEEVASLDPASETYIDSGLSSETEYCYQARARQDQSYSYFTNSDCAETNSGSIPIAVELVDLDGDIFPLIYAHITVSSYGQPLLDLTEDYFQVYEEGVLQTELFEVTLPDSGNQQRLADIVFVMDNSGSMTDEQQQVADNLFDFVDLLTDRSVDFRLGLVRFGTVENSSCPIVEDAGNLTSDSDYFKDDVWQRNVTIGSNEIEEPSFSACVAAAQQINYRPGSQKLIILITDEDDYPETCDGEVIDREACIVAVNAAGGAIYGVTRSDYGNCDYDYVEAGSVTDGTGGQWFDIYDPAGFGSILDHIGQAAATGYIVRYASDHPEISDGDRQVEIVVHALGESGSALGQYNPGLLPQMELTPETEAANQSEQTAGSLVELEIEIDSEPDAAQLFYRAVGENDFRSLNMTLSDSRESRYLAEIPGEDVQYPGVQYYIRVTEGEVVATLPAAEPAARSFNFAVSPNLIPILNHTPIGAAEPQSDVPVVVEASDQTDEIAQVLLFYRQVGDLIYHEAEMILSENPSYSALIPSSILTGDLEYFIRAVDNFGLASSVGTADNPLPIAVQSAIIRGGVYYESQPLPSLIVQAWDRYPDGAVLAQTTTDGNGAYQLMELTNGATYDLRVYSLTDDGPLYFPQIRQDVFVPERDVDFYLSPAPSLIPTHLFCQFYCADNTIYQGYPIQEGDLILAYDEQGTVCGRADMASAGSYTIFVYGDDPYSQEDEGANNGEPVYFEINNQSVSAGIGEPIWYSGQASEVCLGPVQEMIIPLNSGWNLISWNLNTTDDRIESVFGEVWENLQAVMAFDNGVLSYRPSLPPEFNNLDQVSHLSGYWARMSQADTLRITGSSVDPQTRMEFTHNWHLAGYLPDQCDETRHAVGSVMECLIAVLGFDQGALSFRPDLPDYFSNLNDMCPGKGYWFRLSCPADLVYPITQESAQFPTTPWENEWSERDDECPIPDIIPTNQWIEVYGQSLTLNQEPLPVGTSILAYDPDSVACGRFQVHTAGQFGLMPIYGDDLFTEVDEGAEAGDSLGVTICHPDFAPPITLDNAFAWTGFGDIQEVGFALRTEVDLFASDETLFLGDTLRLDLADMVADSTYGAEDMTWTIHGNTHLEIFIEGVTAQIWVSTPQWVGSESFSLRATNPNGSYDTETVEITVDRKMGDMDGDGFLTIGDVQSAAEFLLSSDPLPDDILEAGDYNQDGTLTIFDLILLLDRLP